MTLRRDGIAEESVESALQRVVELASAGIDGCDYASVTMFVEGEPATVVTTDPVAAQIDEVQYSRDSGPCLFSLRRREVVSLESMGEGTSWRPVREAALSRGVWSSLSLPMVAGDHAVGSLNLYGRRERAFSEVPPETPLLLAAQAAAACAAARTSRRPARPRRSG